MTLPRLLLAALLLSGAASPVFAQDGAAKSKPKPKKKPVKAYDYDRSKYKSRDLTEGEIKTYRFNEKGEAVVPKRKPAVKGAVKGKNRSVPPEEKTIERGCSAEMPCKLPDEADAL